MAHSNGTPGLWGGFIRAPPVGRSRWVVAIVSCVLCVVVLFTSSSRRRRDAFFKLAQKHLFGTLCSGLQREAQ